ncbi:hypothetical protein [Aneurinibacillus thermoaerophilus]|uniref:hypothetical protein n=1 Tax=Aneurinibacillus thermoaerophilus TaxID=143495 RepID=UPI002E1E25AC|nr:hypothetical protein [Aneurinibacillus thermoaerophilus]
MIRLFGKYRLTFPVTPAEITVFGHGNDIDTKISITKSSFSRVSARQARGVRFEFMLPVDPQAHYVEVEGYQGPQEWLKGLDRISERELTLVIENIGFSMTVLVGNVEGTYRGKGNFYGSIEFHRFLKDAYVKWTNSKQLLSAPKIMSKQQKTRANPKDKKPKKKSPPKKTQKSKSVPNITDSALKAIQRDRIRSKTGR